MPWAAGVFSRIHNWIADRDANIRILASRHDAEDDNFAAGINQTRELGGTNNPTADLPMATFRHTGAGNAIARQSYATAADVQDQNLTAYADTGVTDAYAITAVPAIVAYALFQRFSFQATNANTGPSTLNVNGVGATPILKEGNVALGGGEIIVGGIYSVTYDGANFQLVTTSSNISISGIGRNFIDGYILRNNSSFPLTDLDINPGLCTDSLNSDTINLPAILVKEIDNNWVAGTNMGGFPSGLVLAINTWYDVFALKNPTTGAVDGGFDDNLAATNLLTDAVGYTLFRRIGSVLTDGAFNIIAFFQDGDDVWWDVNVSEFSGASSTTAAFVVVQSPLRTRCRARLHGQLTQGISGGTPVYMLITSPEVSDQAPGVANQNANALTVGTAFSTYASIQTTMLTDTLSQVRHRVSFIGIAHTFSLQCRGYQDLRGKDGV